MRWARQTKNPLFVDEVVRDSEVWGIALPFWDAFHALSRGRQQIGGMTGGYQALTYEAVTRYAHDYGFAGTGLTHEEFVEAIYALDTVFLEHHRKRAARQHRKGAKKGSS